MEIGLFSWVSHGTHFCDRGDRPLSKYYAPSINSTSVLQAIHESDTKLASYRDYPWFNRFVELLVSSFVSLAYKNRIEGWVEPSITCPCLGNFFFLLPLRSFAFSPKIPGTEIWLRCSQGYLSLFYVCFVTNDATTRIWYSQSRFCRKRSTN